MNGEELTKATEEFLRNNPDSNQRSEEPTSVKRKSEDDEVKESKAQKTVTLEGEKAEEEEDQRRIPKREIEDMDKTSKADKRIRLETNEPTLETIARNFNISLLQRKEQKQIRNR